MLNMLNDRALNHSVIYVMEGILKRRFRSWTRAKRFKPLRASQFLYGLEKFGYYGQMNISNRTISNNYKQRKGDVFNFLYPFSKRVLRSQE